MARMKKRLLFTLTLMFAVWLAWTSIASAQSGDMPNRDMPDRRPPANRHHDHGFDGVSQAVNVSGTVIVEDAIVLELSIKPIDAVIERIELNRNVTLKDFQNQISVSLTELVEFEDLTNDGLTSDDIILGGFVLDSTNLNDVVIMESGDEVIYIITSIDNSFQMIIEINSTDNMPHDWKWSLIIEYDYLSPTSSLAVLHDLTIGSMHIIRERFGNSTEHPNEFGTRRISETHPRLPMFFRWDQNAMADGNNIDVLATNFNKSLSLSFVQGEIITYDPSIGVEQTSIDSADLELINLFDLQSVDKLLDAVFSPTPRGIGIAIVLTSIIAITILISKNKSK
ncbi:MAG: hypothetical protein HeimC2_02830 [Candidatus Heimdallarchaeota archaeon LC_2]|nr:MAG: hypothetical protein HeimC2_02830 [Candidatus Heimdallarchaeota archaeon LC_2]